MNIETERLILREYTMDDYNDLYEILSDPETMKYYIKPYDKAGTIRWINWNLDNYKKYGFGLYAVTLKENGKFIGDCGITMQMINGEQKPEIGYHINKNYQRKGYASEAAKACIDFAFNNTNFDALYSYMKYTNEPSYKTAMKNGMSFLLQYEDPTDVYTKVYIITRKEWQERNK